jgi:hypothetical protein
VAWDLTLAAHFLAATLALGEAFLALAVVETLSRRDLQVLGRIALRHEGRFTLAGLILVSCFFLSLVPLVQGVLFKAHAALGDHAFERAFASHAALASRAGPSPAEAAPAAVALPAAPLLDAAAGARRDRTQALFEAEARYRNALALFPRHYPVLRRYVTVLAELGDPRAHEFFERLREIDPDPRTAALGDWLETRLQRAPGAR